MIYFYRNFERKTGGGFQIKIAVYNSDKSMAMREANLIFNYCRETFPKNRNLVEDYSNEDEMMRVIAKSSVDLYFISAVGTGKRNEGFSCSR